jgi:hypothetical protein
MRGTRNGGGKGGGGGGRPRGGAGFYLATARFRLVAAKLGLRVEWGRNVSFFYLSLGKKRIWAREARHVLDVPGFSGPRAMPVYFFEQLRTSYLSEIIVTSARSKDRIEVGGPSRQTHSGEPLANLANS